MQLIPWIGFLVLVLALLALDLGVIDRKPRVMRSREALAWTAFYAFLALLFNGLVYALYEHHWLGVGLDVGHELSGREAAVRFFTGWVLEKSLSLDNIFVIALIFAYFGIPPIYQHRVLFWGILGALVMRGVMIGAGAALITRFEWVTYVFGGLLLFTAGKMLLAHDEKIDPQKSLLIRGLRRIYPITHTIQGSHFFVVEQGRRVATPLLAALLVVESTDLLFAIDSIPAIFAVTRDPFLVFTSNVFAILGLRALYFALAGLLGRFRFLKPTLVVILAYVGVKMILAHHYHIPNLVSLGVIAGLLTIGVLASVLLPAPPREAGEVAPVNETE